MDKKNNIFVVLRVLIGLLLAVSGSEKLINPIQNFQYVVEGYQLFPGIMESIVARTVPWVELFLGLFCVLGLWLAGTLRATALLFIGFIGVVGQALIRKVPLSECGCFGELISFPPQVILVFDTALLVIILVLIKNISRVSKFSLDEHFDGA